MLLLLTAVIVRGGSGVEGIAQGHLNSSPGLTPKPIRVFHIPIPAALCKSVSALGLTFLILSNKGFGLTEVIQSTNT